LPKAYTSLPADAEQAIRDLVDAGTPPTRSQLVDRYGVTAGTVTLALQRWGIELPKETGKKRALPPGPELLRLLDDRGAAQVAKDFGVTPGAVYNAKNKYLRSVE